MAFTILGFTVSWPLILATIVALFIGRELWRLTYFLRTGIPAPTPLPLIGNIIGMTKGIHTYMLACEQKYGKVFGMYMFSNPILCVADPDMIKDITVKNFSKFVNHDKFVLKNRPFDQGLTDLQFDHWKSVRNVITPTFSALKMKQMSPLINECCDNLVKKMGEVQERDNEVNVNTVFEGFTMEGIAKCAFGLQVDSQNNPNDPFVKNAKQIMDGQIFSPVVVLSGIFPPFAHLMNYLNIGMFPSSVITFFDSVVKKAMAMRKEPSDSKRIDFLQLMMNAHKEDHEKETKANDAKDEHDLHSLIEEHHEMKKTSKAQLTSEEMLAQALLFFVAGYETTNVALGFIAFSLATNQDVQDKLIAEVDEVTPTRDSVNYTNVVKMSYLDGVVCETLRLYPPAGLTDRICNETYTYDGITINKGDQLFLSIFGVHRNAEFWPEPEKFDPERFTKENRERRHQFAWMPFGAGPRNCIGMRFALMEVKMGIVRILQKYRFDVSPNTQIPVQFGERSVKPEGGITLRVVERE